MTVAEFLRWDDGTDTRYELIDGHPMAMVPPLEIHGEIVATICAALRRRLAPPCRPMAEAGIRAEDWRDRFFTADVAVTCAPRVADRRHVAEPVAIFEVLSPSTELHDRGRKVDHYRSLGGVGAIVLVWSTAARV